MPPSAPAPTKPRRSTGLAWAAAAVTVAVAASAAARWHLATPSAAPPSDAVAVFDATPLPGMFIGGGVNPPRARGAAPWPARVRIERARLTPRKPGALEKAVEQLADAGVVTLVDADDDTPWDVLVSSKIGGLERLRVGLRPGQLVASVPEPVTNRRSLASIAARADTGSTAVPRTYVLPTEYSDWLDAAGKADAEGAAADPPTPPSRWILKTGRQGHPVRGHDTNPLSAAAASTMLPQSEYEVAQQLVAPAAHPKVLGEKGTMRLFVLVTNVQPARAYVHADGIVMLRDPAAVTEAARRTGTEPNPLWVGPLSGVGGEALAKQLGKGGVRKLRAKAVESLRTVFGWVSLPGRMGDPHGDLQFSIADGTAFEIFAADVVFAADGRALVTDVTPAATTRLGADFDIFAKPSRVTGAATCDDAHVEILKSGLELTLRRRERALARAAGACARGGRAPAAPRAWAAAGDACSDAPVAEWEAAVAEKLGWHSLGVAADATAPAEMVEDARKAAAGEAVPVKRATTSRDPEAVRRAAEALVAAVGADNIRMN